MANRSDLNNLSLVGRLSRDCEMRTTAGGTSVARFTLAFSTKGKEESKSNFIDCKLWGKPAEALARYLTKGSQVAITGSLEQEQWESDGKKNSRITVNVAQIQLFSSFKASENGTVEQPVVESEEINADIPF